MASGTYNISISKDLIYGLAVGVLFAMLIILAGITLPLIFVATTAPGPAPDVAKMMTPAPTPAPTPTPTSWNPTVLTFTAKYSTTSGGHYEVVTTAGNILYFQNFNQWDSVYPGSVWTVDITGSDGAAYIVGSDVHEISAPVEYIPEYPTYYEYQNRYYQYDGRRLDEVSYKQARGQRVYRTKPPCYKDPGVHIVDTGGIVLMEH